MEIELQSKEFSCLSGLEYFTGCHPLTQSECAILTARLIVEDSSIKVTIYASQVEEDFKERWEEIKDLYTGTFNSVEAAYNFLKEPFYQLHKKKP